MYNTLLPPPTLAGRSPHLAGLGARGDLTTTPRLPPVTAIPTPTYHRQLTPFRLCLRKVKLMYRALLSGLLRHSLTPWSSILGAVPPCPASQRLRTRLWSASPIHFPQHPLWTSPPSPYPCTKILNRLSGGHGGAAGISPFLCRDYFPCRHTLESNCHWIHLFVPMGPLSGSRSLRMAPSTALKHHGPSVPLRGTKGIRAFLAGPQGPYSHTQVSRFSLATATSVPSAENNMPFSGLPSGPCRARAM